MGLAVRRAFRIAKLVAFGIAVAAGVLVMLMMLIIAVWPDR